eukprot:TRINITY_DN3556_c0_g1_i2.p1 TRINITY_DN3556_c0_g1~~TRINITY_DN3556_c0_g1_i2.p1  ORF type:complete len:218 (+),score=51.23 TRINITY_DN3556_c0_g1_i2:69-722(+)
MNDDTTELLMLFQRMGTTDHDQLIKQFQTIVSEVDTATCTFFLEASNWTLQTAIASYFDTTSGNENFSQQQAILNRPKPNASFVLQDDGVQFYYTDSTFVKVWQATNSGLVAWPVGCSLDFISGDILGGPSKLPAPPLPPGSTVDITLNFRTPHNPGQYAGSWMMTTGGVSPMMFGEPIWVIANVVPNPHSTIQPGTGEWVFPQQLNTNNNNDFQMG